jgi:hypothetical protein
MAAINPQDLELVITKPTSAQARVEADMELVLTQPTSAQARVIQDLTLVIIFHPGRNRCIEFFG